MEGWTTQVEVRTGGMEVGDNGVAGVAVDHLTNNRRGVGSVTILLPVSILRANIVKDAAAKNRNVVSGINIEYKYTKYTSVMQQIFFVQQIRIRIFYQF